ncbi:protein related to tpa inducible protein [Purpureocillium lavendulum]|uniref:Protein related to tpa inducible protein n=1 Tax=Purpureocillium lavendulum TaxID=1247861 RepID=A0AB34FLG1_9HYPO|nr:protein related to tpa inducible protein [Purpureocillium lavendulum]
MSSGSCLNDDALGPGVEGCRGDFDFTQKFERIFLSIIPASVFVAAALARIAVVVQRPRMVNGRILQYAKLVCTALVYMRVVGSWLTWLKALLAVFAAVQLCLLVVSAAENLATSRGLVIASTALVFAASVSAIPLSYLEHERAVRPSTVLSVYVLATLLFDIAQARTAWLVVINPYDGIIAKLFTCSLAAKLAILCLEAIPKTRWITWDAEQHSPEESTNIFSLGVYFWLNQLLLRGYRVVLGIENLYPLDVAMSASTLHSRLEQRIEVDRYKRDAKFGLFKDLCKTLADPLLRPVAPRVALIGFKFCQPLFINTVLDFLSEAGETRRADFGYGLIGACALIYLGIAISTAFYDYYNQRAVFSMRGCLVAVIYRKTIVTKLTDTDDSAAVTLMSTDIERIVKGGVYTHELWANIVEIAVGCWLLNSKLGAAFVTPVIVIAVCGLGLVGLLPFFSTAQARWMTRIQNRVGLTAHAIAHMKLYKMSGVAEPVSHLIQGLRVSEISVGNQFRWLVIVSAVLGFAPICLSPVITFAVTSRQLDVGTLFSSIAYIILLASPLRMMFQYVPTLLAGLACIQRIQAFLVAEPRLDVRVKFDGTKTRPVGLLPNLKSDSSQGCGAAFSIDNGSFGWGGERLVLKDIQARIPSRSLTLVIGPVASGKSTFCKALLGEMPNQQGTVTTHVPVNTIGYCEQSPFLYNATLRENVIGVSPFDEKRYLEVLEATLLNTDVLHLPRADQTRIGSNGIMLSGGQKQRVSVARALYSNAEVMLFDDVLSGLDANTEDELFQRVFGPEGVIRRRNATAIVCTHSVKHLPSADHIIALGDQGNIVGQGHFSDLVESNSYVRGLGLADRSGDVDVEKSPPGAQEVAMGAETTPPVVESEAMSKSRQTGDWAVYMHYFRSVHPLSLVTLVITALVYGFCNNFATAWLKFWSDDTFAKPATFYVGVYALLKTSQLTSFAGNGITTLISMITFAGTELHRRALGTVVAAPLRFFTTTDSGVVTNLFSQDLTLIDGDLPTAFTNVTLDLADMVGMACVIAAASPYLAIGYPALFGILYVIQKFYLRTSRQLRLLDLEAKSPLYTHFIDTIRGVATIRAFGWTQAEIERSNVLLDTSQRPAYLLGVLQKWLMTSLQLLVAGLAVVLVSLATQLHTNAGLTGASLVTLLSFGETLSELIKYYTGLETSIGAVNRLRSFSDTVVPEDLPGEDDMPPESWPADGRLDMKCVSASYDTASACSAERLPGSLSQRLCIRDLSLTILPGQKVALCGRTGSGKSTLILLVLRLLDPLPICADGIELDGAPLSRVDRATLRKRIIAIPQDVVFLPDGSSIRSNIDPFGASTSEECLAALSIVQLAHFVEHKGGLDGCMGAADLSAGQKQLFSLGRAILRKRVKDCLVGGVNPSGGLLLLDEVSSNVDVVTDRMMQQIIQREFASYTIIMVAHRLDMVVNYFDHVVVLDQGAVVEQGAPSELVGTPGTRFGELWEMRGPGRGEITGRTDLGHVQ